MMKNKKGEGMVEAAIVLPLMILTVLSLLMVILYYFDCHQAQIQMHQALIQEWDQGEAVFDIKKKTTETSSRISGAVELVYKHEGEGKIYIFSPAACIRLGEMLNFDDEE